MKDDHPENDVRSVTSGVRLRVLFPLVVAMILLVLVFVVLFILEARNRQAEDIARTAASVEKLFKEQTTEGIQVMRSIMELVMGDHRLEVALRAGDRKTLLDISEPILKEIRAKNKITHLYYILPDLTTLLRVHIPDQFGDKIDRFGLQETARTGKPFWGNEQGPFGSFTLRVTYPWYSNGDLIGYLEMGIEFEEIIQASHQLLDVDLFIVIDKQFVDRVKWESMQKQKGEEASWDEFPSVLILSRTKPTIPPPLAAYLAILKEKHRRHAFETAWDDNVAQTIVAPFIDLRERELGELIVLRDITGAASERRRTILWVATLGTMIGGALTVFFYILLGRVQQDVAERTARLTEAQRVLTIEQFERLRAERELGLHQERIELLEIKGQMVQELIQAKKALEDRSDELQGVNKQLELEITEREQAEAEVRRLNAGLERTVEERTRQLIEAQEELVRKEKLAILGQLSGSVGHELRNPLGVMSNAVYFLKMVLADADETVIEYLGIINKEIDSSLRIITDLLDFARTRAPQIQTVTARALIDASLRRCTFPENVVLHDEVEPTLPLLRVDPLQMEQVLQDLIMNGVQAMPAGGRLTLRGRRNIEGTVWLEVADTGVGIAPENIKKLFQPLFTTKAKGIGLGLVVCRNLTEANGGRIEVASEAGKGTVFTIRLPSEGGGI